MLLTLMIVLALAICVEGSSRSYAIDKVLVSVPLSLGQTHLVVEVRALGHCQMDKSVVKILKTQVFKLSGKLVILNLVNIKSIFQKKFMLPLLLIICLKLMRFLI